MAAKNPTAACYKCHDDPFVRSIHLLQMNRDQKLTHLKAEFRSDKSGFIKSEMVWQDFIVHYYTDWMVEADGTPMPCWKAFLESKCHVTYYSGGFHAKPKRIEYTAEEIRQNCEYYQRTGTIKPSAMKKIGCAHS